MPFLDCNGAKLFYSDSGSGRETIFFSHGLLFTHEMFRYQVDHFTKAGYRCIAYDHRGQGKSETTPGDYDTEIIYEDAISLLKQLNIGPVHFVGLSMGGFVGMQVAARNPTLLKSLCLMETNAGPETNKLKYWIMIRLVKLFGTRIIAGSLMKILIGKSFLKDPANKNTCKDIRSAFAQLPRSILQPAKAVIYRKGIYDELAQIVTPTMVMVGDEDIATKPVCAEKIHRLIRNSKLEYIRNAGHSSCFERPGEVNAYISDFLGKIP